MKTVKIECPSCQQPIEINPPPGRPGLPSAAIVCSGLIIAAAILLSHRRAESPSNPVSIAPPQITITNVLPIASASATNWEYRVVLGDDVSEGHGLIFEVSTNDASANLLKPITAVGLKFDPINAHGMIELTEQTVLACQGDNGWELVSGRPAGPRMIWTFKRPAK